MERNIEQNAKEGILESETSQFMQELKLGLKASTCALAYLGIRAIAGSDLYESLRSLDNAGTDNFFSILDAIAYMGAVTFPFLPLVRGDYKIHNNENGLRIQ